MELLLLIANLFDFELTIISQKPLFNLVVRGDKIWTANCFE
jgi:hypothetical protein